MEKILPADPEGEYPICVTGKRNDPIEDCGGIYGYEELLEVLADPAHEEHKQISSWLRRSYGVSAWDGNTFDLAAVNERLKELRQRNSKQNQSGLRI